jgi:hypothetical protein
VATMSTALPICKPDETIPHKRFISAECSS